ncbi:MAG: hypothetical protein LJE65_02845, partial [Desulfobacteraceae bacterium]|nr:hypothetical protein [Desulfobacteraceae bacterium]
MKTDRSRIDILRQIQARQLSPEQGLRLMRSPNRKGIADKPLHPEPIPGTEHRTPATEVIAVIGMAGRFPGAQNLNRFWKNL